MNTSKKYKDAEADAVTKNGPEKQFRIDDVSASIFTRSFSGRVYRSVSFTRSYKSADGSWKYTKTFSVEDLGKVVTVAQQAAEWINEKNAEQ